ncbi:monocarboxylate transporter 14-like isoform X2 [Patella vulgata]|uniref:monocarboxylate transporter 14-like isoform X2 n=1 Tax=Patella vulgata TaxID=6465 RepID=UPI0024A7B420|nr:monocarboxylate transporter 14-like isoform X2 [Patella vulgata]
MKDNQKDIITEEEVEKLTTDQAPEAHDPSTAEEVIDPRIPIDRGWAWVVMIACMLNATITAGYGRTLGLLFVEYLDLFKASATITTLVFGVMAAALSISGFITMNFILEKTTVRKVVLVGVCLSSGGVILSCLANGVLFLIFTQFLVGIGNATINSPGLVLIGRYFNKRRALATAVAKTGISLGSLTFPIFLRYLLDTFALRGTLLIMGGIQCQMFVFALLLRGPETFAPTKQVIVKITKPELPEKASSKINMEMKFLKSVSQDQKAQEIPENGMASPLPVQRLRTVSDGAKYSAYKRQHSRTELGSDQSFIDSLSNSRILKYVSNLDLLSVSTTDVSTEASTSQKLPKKKTDSASNKNKYLCKFTDIIDFTLVKNSMFILLMSIAFFAITLFVTTIYLPALFIENGANESDAALFLTVAGVSDVASRLFAGAIADLGIIKRHHIMMISLFIGGISAQFTRYCTSFGLQIVYSLVYGLSVGPYAALLPVILTDFLGIENLGKSMGFISLVHGAAICACHPIVGKCNIQDTPRNINSKF